MHHSDNTSDERKPTAGNAAADEPVKHSPTNRIDPFSPSRQNGHCFKDVSKMPKQDANIGKDDDPFEGLSPPKDNFLGEIFGLDGLRDDPNPPPITEEWREKMRRFYISGLSNKEGGGELLGNLRRFKEWRVEAQKEICALLTGTQKTKRP